MVSRVNRSSDWKFCRIASALFLLMAISMGAQAAVQAELDRKRIVEGETVTLTFRTDDAKQNMDTDFSALEKDFEILDRRSETQLSIVNGQQTAVVRLVLTVEPRRTGQLLIPAVTFGDSSTKPLALEVEPAPQLAPGALPPVFIEVEIRPGDGPYFVHSQFGLVVRVFYQQNLTEAAISPPEPSPASVRLLQETPFQAERGGERYRVLERNYAIFPERSGELVIPAMKLSGRLVKRRSSGVWQPTTRGRRVNVKSEELRLNIEPKPAAFSGDEWQPARDFRITQQISSADALRVGEPVTRTVLIDAIGLEENMIAEPAWPDLANARIYPDQPQGITRDDGNWVLGHKEFRYAVVPEQEGELILPELAVEWWDTKNNRLQKAVLPAHTLFVQPSALVPPPPPTELAQAPAAGTALTAPHAARVETSPGYWRWLTMLFAVLWLLTLLLALRFRSGNTAESTANGRQDPIPANEAAALEHLRRACQADDRRESRRALQTWLRESGYGGNGSLFDFAAELGDEALRDGIYSMDSDGYRQDSENTWNGKAFWTNFETWRAGRLAKFREQKPPLTDLYARENRRA
jgi:hypothetical protein